MSIAAPKRLIYGGLVTLLAACAKAPPALTVPVPMPVPPSTPAVATASTMSLAPSPPKPSPSAKAKPSSNKSAAKPTAGKAPTKAAASATDPVAEIRTGIQTLMDTTQNFTAEVSNWNTANGEKESCTVTYTWAKPDQTAFEILESSNSSNVGVKIVWPGGDTAKARAKVLGLPVKVDMPITDSRLVNKRGHTFADTSIQTWARDILDPKAQITVRGKQTISGKDSIVFDCVSSHLLGGITKEVFALDMQTKAPLMRQMYEGDTCVYEATVKQVAFNVTLPADAFQL